MNSTLQKITCLLLLTTTYLNSRSQSDGTLDATFGSGGLVTIDNSDTDDGNDLLILQSKDIVIGGTTFTSSLDFSICALTSSGVLDNNFGTSGKLIVDIANGSDDYLSALALDSSQRIVAAGYSKTGPIVYITVLRITAQGIIDSTFGTNGIVMLNPVTANVAYDVAIQPDHKIVVAGFVDDGSTPIKTCVIRLNEDGSYDGSFGDNGVTEGSPDPSFDAIAYSIALQSDGNILIGGYQDVNGDDQFAVGRILSGGSMDVSFGGDGWIVKNITNGTVDIAHSITLQADGKILAAGESNGQVAICRFNTDGSDDTGFANSGTFIDPLQANDDILYSVIIQPDQNILAAGGGSINDNVDFLLFRLKPEGVYDSTFGTAGIVYTNYGYYTSDYVHSILLQPDLAIVAAGSTLNGYFTDFAIARYGNGATNIYDEGNNQSSLIFPTPCDENCFVRIPGDHKRLNIEITDVMGRKVQSFIAPYGESSFQINTSNCSPGIYFVQLTDELQSVIAREKFVIR